jgi:hypothetical protein
MEATSNPRITCGYLNSYVGKSVIIVGKVIQLRGDEALIDADGNITVHLNRVSLPNYPSSCLPSEITHTNPPGLRAAYRRHTSHLAMASKSLAR